MVERRPASARPSSGPGGSTTSAGTRCAKAPSPRCTTWCTGRSTATWPRTAGWRSAPVAAGCAIRPSPSAGTSCRRCSSSRRRRRGRCSAATAQSSTSASRPLERGYPAFLARRFRLTLRTRFRVAWVRLTLERFETLRLLRLPLGVGMVFSCCDEGRVYPPDALGQFRGKLLEPVLLLQLPGQVLLRDEADTTAGERFQLELEAGAHHLRDLALPLLRAEPRVGEHLLGPRDVAVVHLDGDVGGQL